MAHDARRSWQLDISYIYIQSPVSIAPPPSTLYNRHFLTSDFVKTVFNLWGDIFAFLQTSLGALRSAVEINATNENWVCSQAFGNPNSDYFSNNEPFYWVGLFATWKCRRVSIQLTYWKGDKIRKAAKDCDMLQGSINYYKNSTYSNYHIKKCYLENAVQTLTYTYSDLSSFVENMHI